MPRRCGRGIYPTELVRCDLELSGAELAARTGYLRPTVHSNFTFNFCFGLSLTCKTIAFIGALNRLEYNLIVSDARTAGVRSVREDRRHTPHAGAFECRFQSNCAMRGGSSQHWVSSAFVRKGQWRNLPRGYGLLHFGPRKRWRSTRSHQQAENRLGLRLRTSR